MQIGAGILNAVVSLDFTSEKHNLLILLLGGTTCYKFIECRYNRRCTKFMEIGSVIQNIQLYTQ